MAAEKFGIDPLKDLARDRLASCLQRNWNNEEFPQVVRSVFQPLPPHETQLPDIITARVKIQQHGLFIVKRVAHKAV